MKNIILIFIIYLNFFISESAIALSNTWLNYDELEFTVEGEVNIVSYTSKREIDKVITRENNVIIDKIEIVLNSKYLNDYHFKSSFETSNIGESDEEDIFVSELYLDIQNTEYSMQVGRIQVPFGNYNNYFISDHQTKELGETKTELGFTFENMIGLFSNSFTIFVDNYRTTEEDQNGFSINSKYSPYKGVTIGGGYISVRKAIKNQPELLNVYASIDSEKWSASAEIVSAIDETYENRPSAFSLEAEYRNNNFSYGTRLQRANKFSVLDEGVGNYKEMAIAANYLFSDYVSFRTEFILAEEENNSNKKIKERTILSQMQVVF